MKTKFYIYGYCDTMRDKHIYVKARSEAAARRRINRSKFKKHDWALTGSSRWHDFDEKIIQRLDLIAK